MLDGLLKGDLKMSKTINNYLDLCLKCGACSKFCPSGIDIIDIIAAAKYEYFKSHKIEKLISLFQKKIILSLFLILYLSCVRNLNLKLLIKSSLFWRMWFQD